ncbi:MAG: SipW-dependent-type signal peptide-containing protein [Candidatus Limivicinus sp.]|nr:SipW-dependent-type signal peptide-containing protein [Candidatus Limivicinus sp.]
MKKTLTVVIALVLVVVMSVAGTVAYLTSQAAVTNSFTVGTVEITLDETDVDLYGSKDGETRVAENTYKLIPGHTYTKDPIVHVGADSEDCWLFVKVENGLSAIEDSNATIADQLRTNGWTLVAGTTNIYAYRAVVSANDDVPVFGSFKLAGTADVASYANARIDVTAYAVQADSFTTAADAWTAAGLA